MIRSIRTGRIYNAVIMFIGSCIAALAAFALSVDSLILAKTPDTVLGCDVNGKLSCSSVSKSAYANLMPLWGTQVPNAFFGLIAFGIFIGFTGALMFGYRPIKQIKWLLGFGVAFCVLLAGWLLLASILFIHVLCPWCLTMDCGVILIVIGYVRWMIACNHDGGPESNGLKSVNNEHMLTGSVISVLIEIIPFLIIGLLAVMTFFG